MLLPAGVDEESVLRVRAQGDAGWHGGQAGDLYIGFAVKPASGMLREGLDVHSEVGRAGLLWTTTPCCSAQRHARLGRHLMRACVRASACIPRWYERAPALLNHHRRLHCRGACQAESAPHEGLHEGLGVQSEVGRALRRGPRGLWPLFKALFLFVPRRGVPSRVCPSHEG